MGNGWTALAGTLCLAFATLARGGDFPAKPIRLVLPYPVSGPQDIRGAARLTKLYKLISENSAPAVSDALARHVAVALTAAYGRPVIQERRPGGNMTAGIGYVAASAPDGHTLLLASNAAAVIHPLYFGRPDYTIGRELAPVAMLASMPYVIGAHVSIAVQSVEELPAWLRARQGEIHFSSSGNGSTAHLAGELFRQATGARILHVPFNGGYASLNALVTGQVQLAFAALPALLPYVDNDRFTVLAQTGAARHPRLPDVTTLQEAGYPGFVVEAWYGVFAPPQTSPAVLAALEAAISRGYADRATQDAVRALGLVPAPGTDRLSDRIHAETDRWRSVVSRLPGAG